ncbi:AraC family transcriptional regulator [uncultured Pseudomonas sp.]|uniref:helix-turn-helix domain-containing protein n=1 Tax=uncultured Pseudomonas sp. TaxID=114707 RepID=UPI0025EA5736|nr:AraC family transcriptional regulator [uncultured Pseudomonas sp.]
MDTLSDVLALLKSHRSTFAGLKAGGTWAINFAAPDGIKFNAVVEGSCWLEVEGLAVPMRLAREYASPLQGAALMTEHLAQMMLVQILRLYQSSMGASTTGWLAALNDPRLAPVLREIHAAPARRWTLSEMADVASQSRSTFALHFKQRVGLAPQEYLTRWRMHLAVQALKASDNSVSTIGQALGYQSDSAFSNAFKRVMACSPREYRERTPHKEPRDERYPAAEGQGQRH